MHFSPLSAAWEESVTPVLLAVASAFLFRYWWSRRRLRELAHKIPGPRSLPIVGDLLTIAANPTKLIDVMNDSVKTYGSTFRLWLGPFLYITITDPRDIEAVIGNRKFLLRDKHILDVYKPYLGDGLITSNGEIWKRHRKMINSTFHIKILEQFIEKFSHNVQVMVKKLEKYADGSTFDVHNIVGLCTLDMVTETVMGTVINAQTEKDCEFTNVLELTLKVTTDRILMPWLRIDCLFWMTKHFKDYIYTKKAFHEFVDEIITKKTESYEEELRTEKTTKEPFSNVKKRLAFLDLLIRSSETGNTMLSKEEIRDEVCTMIVAGQETAAKTISYILVMLALHPEHQARVFEEVTQVFAEDYYRSVVPEDLPKLKCLERAIKETLRLFPSAPLVMRTIHEEVKLSQCTLPAGCTVVANYYALHRNPECFPDPYTFNPDRFLSENVAGRHPYSYLPFSAGLRNCVGSKYAMMLMKTVLATVIRNFQVLPACTREDMEQIVLGIIISPLNGFKVKMVPRMKPEIIP